MIRVTVVPKSRENLYGLLVKKEIALRKRNQGTLHRLVPQFAITVTYSLMPRPVAAGVRARRGGR